MSSNNPDSGNQQPISLRTEVLPSDAEAVRQLVDETGVFRLDEVEVAVELVTERLAKGLASGYHFVFAERAGQRDGKLLGYASYGAIACSLHSFDLYWIAVDPALQGQGIGRLLLSASEKHIAELGGSRVYIETSGKNEYLPTREFYLRCGYLQEACLKDFYAPGDDKIIYVRTITP